MFRCRGGVTVHVTLWMFCVVLLPAVNFTESSDLLHGKIVQDGTAIRAMCCTNSSALPPAVANSRVSIAAVSCPLATGSAATDFSCEYMFESTDALLGTSGVCVNFTVASMVLPATLVCSYPFANATSNNFTITAPLFQVYSYSRSVRAGSSVECSWVAVDGSSSRDALVIFSTSDPAAVVVSTDPLPPSICIGVVTLQIPDTAPDGAYFCAYVRTTDPSSDSASAPEVLARSDNFTVQALSLAYSVEVASNWVQASSNLTVRWAGPPSRPADVLALFVSTAGLSLPDAVPLLSSNSLPAGAQGGTVSIFVDASVPPGLYNVCYVTSPSPVPVPCSDPFLITAMFLLFASPQTVPCGTSPIHVAFQAPADHSPLDNISIAQYGACLTSQCDLMAVGVPPGSSGSAVFDTGALTPGGYIFRYFLSTGSLGALSNPINVTSVPGVTCQPSPSPQLLS